MQEASIGTSTKLSKCFFLTLMQRMSNSSFVICSHGVRTSNTECGNVARWQTPLDKSRMKMLPFGCLSPEGHFFQVGKAVGIVNLGFHVNNQTVNPTLPTLYIWGSEHSAHPTLPTLYIWGSEHSAHPYQQCLFHTDRTPRQRKQLWSVCPTSLLVSVTCWEGLCSWGIFSCVKQSRFKVLFCVDRCGNRHSLRTIYEYHDSTNLLFGNAIQKEQAFQFTSAAYKLTKSIRRVW